MDKASLKDYKLYSIRPCNSNKWMKQDTRIDPHLPAAEFEIMPYILLYLKWTEKDYGVALWASFSDTLQKVLDSFLIVGEGIMGDI